eukprot:g23711.t1
MLDPTWLILADPRSSDEAVITTVWPLWQVQSLIDRSDPRTLQIGMNAHQPGMKHGEAIAYNPPISTYFTLTLNFSDVKACNEAAVTHSDAEGGHQINLALVVPSHLGSVGEWPPRALALTRPDHSTTATRQQVGVGGSRLHPAYLPPPDPGKIGPLDPLPTFGAGLGHSLPKLPPLAGPASAVGTTLPLYAGGYGGALPPGPGLDHGVEYPDAHYPPWASGTPPTDITEPWVPGFYNARDDLTKISFSSMPPLLCIIHAWQRPKWLRPAGFL